MRLFLLACLIPLRLAAQDFTSLLARVDSLPESSRAALVDSVMRAIGTFPYVEGDTLAHFLYRGAASSLSLAGDMNGWNTASDPMTRVSTTDLWHRARSFEPDARLDYKYVLNGSQWLLDPKNPRQVSGGFGPNSELRMPRYPPHPELEPDPAIPHGNIFDTTIASGTLHNSRNVKVYLPPGYDTSVSSHPLILFHDGLEYLSLAGAQNVLDYLIATRRIPPVIGLFVPPVDRNEEYAGSRIDAFGAFIVRDLLGWADRRFRTSTDARWRATFGASNGGNIALYLGLQYPGIFGNVAAQSSNVIGAVSTGYQNQPKREQKFYLDLGTYDLPVLIPLVRNFVPILRAKGYDCLYREYHEGHSWGNWRAHIGDALIYFFPFGETGAGEHGAMLPSRMTLDLYPNPLRPGGDTGSVASIRCSTVEPGAVSLKIFDSLGRSVAAWRESFDTAGTHILRWDAAGCRTGVYCCTIETASGGRSARLVLLR